MPAHHESIALGVAVANAADDIKAQDPRLYDVADIVGVVDVFVVVSASSNRQLDAIVDHVERVLSDDHDATPLRREGTPASGWIVLDYGTVVVHAFTQAQREHYDLDRLCSDAAMHDAFTGELVREMVEGADDRGVDEDVHLGLAGRAVGTGDDEAGSEDESVHPVGLHSDAGEPASARSDRAEPTQ